MSWAFGWLLLIGLKVGQECGLTDQDPAAKLGDRDRNSESLVESSERDA
jgi:hypothetical protein